jgi:hypothetical protein
MDGNDYNPFAIVQQHILAHQYVNRVVYEYRASLRLPPSGSDFVGDCRDENCEQVQRKHRKYLHFKMNLLINDSQKNYHCF